MTSSPLNPSQHVERIREILIGRDLQNMHGRISRIEGALEKDPPANQSSNLQEAISDLKEEQASIRQELQVQQKQSDSSLTSKSLLEANPLANKEQTAELAARIDARIDARFREILSHLQNELLQLKGQLDTELSTLKSEKADRTELSKRFARLANAAMENENPTAEEKTEGFLL